MHIFHEHVNVISNATVAIEQFLQIQIDDLVVCFDLYVNDVPISGYLILFGVKSDETKTQR